MNRCAARGCGRWTRADETFCQRHGETERDYTREPHADLVDDAQQESFAARLSGGDYASLLTPGLRDALRQAAADTGLESEIGALRVALLRLLQEERDPSRMASGIARVAGVALQTLRAQQASHAMAPDIRLAVVQALLTIEAEQAEEQEDESAHVGGEGGDGHDAE